MRNQELLFDAVEDIITPGNFITFRGEDGALFGWLFDGKVIDYSSYDELKELSKKFELKEHLETTLPKENSSVKTKLKV